MQWDKASTRLERLPLAPGEKVEMNAASFSTNGYAYTANQMIVW